MKFSSKHTLTTALLLTTMATGIYANSNVMAVKVTNPGNTHRSETIELSISDIAQRLGHGFYDVEQGGMEVPSQITYDSLLIFQTTLAPQSSVVYNIDLRDSKPVYDTIATGRIYPERADDMAWENDLVGFRAYGPATQRNKERAYGYDIFFKHPNKRPVLKELYGMQTDSKRWATADSLKRISRKLSEDYISSFSYHVDHGLGMDCYAVGATLGDGVAARLVNDSIAFAWCYESAEILDSGPIRFTARLHFAPVGGITETRVITLDAGQHLNTCTVSFDGMRDTTYVVAGVPRRDNSEAIMGSQYIAYADPTQGSDNGKAMLAVFIPDKETLTEEREGHIVVRTALAPDEKLRYHFGFAWDRADIPNMKAWREYLENFIRPQLLIEF